MPGPPFLTEMEGVVPWSALCALIEPFYPKPGNWPPPAGGERMLRIYFLQQWFNLSDPAVEEALYDSQAMRCFVGIDLGREPVPDETTVCRFRHLFEQHDLGRQLFDEVQPAHDLRTGQSVHSASASVALPTGVVCRNQLGKPCRHSKRRQRGPNYTVPSLVRRSTCPHLCTSPVQTFLRCATGPRHGPAE